MAPLVDETGWTGTVNRRRNKSRKTDKETDQTIENYMRAVCVCVGEANDCEKLWEKGGRIQVFGRKAKKKRKRC